MYIYIHSILLYTCIYNAFFYIPVIFAPEVEHSVEVTAVSYHNEIYIYIYIYIYIIYIYIYIFDKS